MPQDSVEYAAPAQREHRRGPGKWLLLIVLWMVGLAIWVLYLVAIGYLLLRFL